VARNDGKHQKMTRYDRGFKNNMSTPNSCYNTLGPCFLATLGHVEFTSTHWGITRYIPPLPLIFKVGKNTNSEYFKWSP
jgi:hypothetical protein